MKAGGLILLGLGAYAVYYFSGLAVAAAVLNVVFDDIQFNGVNSLTLYFKLQNVSNSTLIINSLEGDVTINGNDLGNVSFFPGQPLQVLSNSETRIGVNLNIGLLSLPGTIKSLLSKGSGTFDVIMTGHANINNQVVPIDSETNFSFSG